MLKELEEIQAKYGIILKGIIHVGAHEGQEYDDYCKAGMRNMIFFEPIQENFEKLLETLKDSDARVHCFDIALGNEIGTRQMYVESANKGMSCSILEPGSHLKQYPWIVFDEREVVKIDKLDNILFDRKKYNILNVDVQGFELEVFKGGVKTLKHIDVIFTEINKEEVYKGCALYLDIDIFLADHEFIRVTDDPLDSWGEATYVKNKFFYE